MTADHKPEHTFRVELDPTDIRFVEADHMTVNDHGVVQLYIMGEIISEPVAAFFPMAGLSVVRVDTMITKEGLAGA